MANFVAGDSVSVDKQALWKRPGFLAFSIIAATTLARLWFVATSQLNLVQDEAQYWDWSRHLQLSYYSKGPLVAYVIALGTKLFGNTELGVRIGAVVGSMLLQAAAYGAFAAVFKRPRLGVWVLVVMNTTLIFLASGVLMTTDNPLVLCWAGALFCLHWSAFGKRRTLALVLLTLFLALGILAKYSMLGFGLTALVYVWLLRRTSLLPRGYVLRLGTALAVGVILGCLPIVMWNLDNDFVSFRHVATLAGVAETEGKPFLRLDTLPEYLGSQLGLLTPWWLLLMVVEGWRGIGRLRRAGKGPVDRAGAEDLKLDALLAAGFWPVFLFFLVWSVHTQIYPNWAGVCYVAGVVLAARSALGIMDAAKGAAPGRWKQSMVKVCVGLGVAVFVLVHLQNWLPLPADLNPMTRLKGWEHLGQEVLSFRDAAFEDPERVFFFSDEYDMTAALAFYIPGQPTTFCAFVDRRMSQYDLWPGPEDKLGWDAIYVRKRFKDMSQTLSAMFDRVENVEFQSLHRGEPARKFTVTLCYGFHGPWPQALGNHY